LELLHRSPRSEWTMVEALKAIEMPELAFAKRLFHQK
jgi:hypothetical protein